MNAEYLDHLERDEYRRNKNLPVPFPIPAKPELPVWRIMGPQEFEAVLQGNLSLTRVVDFPDKLEGQLPLETHYSLLIDEGRESLESYLKRNEALRGSTFVSCWRMDDQENREAWSQYAGDNADKVAIQTTVFDLWDSCTKIADGMSTSDSRLGILRVVSHPRATEAHREKINSLLASFGLPIKCELSQFAV